MACIFAAKGVRVLLRGFVISGPTSFFAPLTIGMANIPLQSN